MTAAADGLTALGLCDLADAIVRREVSSVAATEAYLTQIRAHAEPLNCFLKVEAEDALAAAEKADAALAAGTKPGPLHGVPLAHKDLFYRAGRVTTCGARIRQDFVPEVTATVMTRMERAGAITLGALNLSEFAMGPTGWNEHTGPARNPWNLGHVSGGSSSGSGSAVGARLTPGSLGTDTGGSIRVPAALCGVTGLKPTQGRVSRYGVLPLSHSLDCVGPLARSARDCARLLAVIAGPDGADPTTGDEPVPDYEGLLDGDIRGLRVAVPRSLHDRIADPEVRRAVEKSLEVLRRLGAVPVEVPAPDLALLNTLNGLVFLCEAATVHGAWLRSRRDEYGPQVRERLDTGLLFPATRYLEAMSMRGRLMEAFVTEMLGDADLLHMPAVPETAPPVAAAASRDMKEIMALNARLTPFLPAANYLGLPAIGVPAGFAGGRRPVGFQMVARPFAEGLLLKAADAYQGATDWHTRLPQLS